MSRTFEPPWEWPAGRRDEAVLLARLLHGGMRDLVPERPSRSGQRSPFTLTCSPDNLALLAGCFPFSQERGRAAVLRVFGRDVYCHPQPVHPDLLRLRQGMRQHDLYHAPGLSPARLELYRCLRADGIDPARALVLASELAPA